MFHIKWSACFFMLVFDVCLLADAAELMHLPARLVTVSDSRSRELLFTQTKIGLPRTLRVIRTAAATQNVVWCMTYYDGSFAFGVGDETAAVLRIGQQSKVSDMDSNWAIGAIDSISISPTGKYIFLSEDNGRFCILNRHRRDAGSQYWLPAIVAGGDSTFECFGLAIGDVQWLNGPERLAISYVDGRILILNPESGICEELLSSLWTHAPVDSAAVELPLQVKIFSEVIKGVDTLSSGDRVVNRLLAMNDDRYFIAAHGGAAEIHSRIDNRLLYSTDWSDALVTTDENVLVFRRSGAKLQGLLVNLDAAAATKTWDVAHDTSFNTGHLLMIDQFVHANGDIQVISFAGHNAPAWKILLPSSSSDGKLFKVLIPNDDEFAVGIRDTAIDIFRVEFDKTHMTAKLTSKVCTAE